MEQIRIVEESPTAADVVALLRDHLAFARATSPPDHVHALDLDGLAAPDVTFYTARADGVLVGVGALREIDARHGELKSMHTRAASRGRGVGDAIVVHLLAVARRRGYERVSLETGTQDEFAAARRLYARHGFAPCPPFADYTDNPYSVCMTLTLAEV